VWLLKDSIVDEYLVWCSAGFGVGKRVVVVESVERMNLDQKKVYVLMVVNIYMKFFARENLGWGRWRLDKLPK
jgi:hypothetical protein